MSSIKHPLSKINVFGSIEARGYPPFQKKLSSRRKSEAFNSHYFARLMTNANTTTKKHEANTFLYMKFGWQLKAGDIRPTKLTRSRVYCLVKMTQHLGVGQAPTTPMPAISHG